MQITLSSENYTIADSGHVFLFGEHADLNMDIAVNEV